MTRALMFDRHGGPEVLRLGEVEVRKPGPGEVLLDVRAAGINPYDGKVRSGFIPTDAPFPRRVGSDLAGTVDAVGENARYWDGTPAAVGDEVLGHGAGSVAEQVVVPVANLARRPEGIPSETAAGLHVAGLTAVSVITTVPVGPEDTVLVGGGSGAVGFVAAQLAAHAGATVAATASPRNHELLRSVGIAPIAYGAGLAGRVREEIGEITAVFDCHGRDALDAGVELGVPVDRMVAIAGYAAVDELGVKNVERAARTTENLAGLADRIAAGEIAFPVAQTFALSDAVEAFRALEASHAPGKIVITMS